MNVGTDQPLLLADQLVKRFGRGAGRVGAVDGVSLAVRPGRVTGLVGPDGAGKTTLLRLCAGLLAPDGGKLKVLEWDVAQNPVAVQEQVGYMPQRFGLYEDLSVQENLELYADLQAVSGAVRGERFPRLLAMTGLGPFTGRLAGRLSGGMKQKLGLACALIKLPRLLLLDEPTVGVDPVSRRDLWRIVYEMVERERIGVLLSTAYLDEAERCHDIVVLDRGRVLAGGTPEEFHRQVDGRVWGIEADGEAPRDLRRRMEQSEEVIDASIQSGRVRVVTRSAHAQALAALVDTRRVEAVPARFEDAFMALMHAAREARARPAVDALVEPTERASEADAVVEVQDLSKRFGEFVAVDDISFSVGRGEVFGLLGPNGAGKTTTFRMLCGLLPASGGKLLVAGHDLRHSPAKARQRIGYMAQKFSLYGLLNARENLRFYGRAYGLRGEVLEERVEQALRDFELLDRQEEPADELPGGYKQRLAMAAALLHRPPVLFLDEPTSGVDPLARREFWTRITAAARSGVTVIVTTHFMEEAEYCDRLLILSRGRPLALGTPGEIRARGRDETHPAPTVEDAFIKLAEAGTNDGAPAAGARAARASTAQDERGWEEPSPTRWEAPTLRAKLLRLRGLMRKESLQIRRDPSSIALALVMPVVLLILFGYGVTFDAEKIEMAVVLGDRGPAAQALYGRLVGSRYFVPQAAPNLETAREWVARRRVAGLIHVRSNFERQLHSSGGGEVQVIVDGVDANRARLIVGYARGVVQGFNAELARGRGASAERGIVLQQRIWFNEELDSRRSLVPGLIALIMTFTGILLTALVLVREKERGTLEALLVTPIRAGEIMIAKLVPYFLLGLAGLALSVVLGRVLFDVPLRAAPTSLLLLASLFMLASLGVGLLISALAPGQMVASSVSVVLGYLPAFFLSGLLFDLQVQPGWTRVVSVIIPTTYFIDAAKTLFLAGDFWSVLWKDAAVLALMAAVLLTIARLKMRKRL